MSNYVAILQDFTTGSQMHLRIDAFGESSARMFANRIAPMFGCWVVDVVVGRLS